MVKIWIVLAYIVGIIVLFFSYAFEFVKYGQTGSEKYSFLRNFPYELNQFKIDSSKSYILAIIEILGSCLFSVASLFFAINYQNVNPTSAYILFAVSTFVILCFNVLRFVKLRNYRLHLLLTSIFVVSNLLLLLLYYFFFTNSDYGYAMINGVRITEIILILLLIIVLLKKRKEIKKELESYNHKKERQ